MFEKHGLRSCALSKRAGRKERTLRKWPSLVALGSFLLAYIGIVPPCQASSTANPATGRPFEIFDSMDFRGQPDFARYGFRHLRIVDAHELWKPGGDINQVPAREQISKIVATGKGPRDMVVVDIEHWSMDAAHASESLRKFVLTLDQLRATAPNWRLGVYSVLPGREYWRAIEAPGGIGYRSWQGENDRTVPLVSHVDMLFPSLYTFYPDQQGWVRYATANLREARRLARGKPVYCFLWMQYHDASKRPYDLLAPDYWRLQLETCRRFADGVVIWGGIIFKDNKYSSLPWDENAAWWKTTLDFLRS
jgi:hypothetical protein